MAASKDGAVINRPAFPLYTQSDLGLFVKGGGMSQFNDTTMVRRTMKYSLPESAIDVVLLNISQVVSRC